MEAREEKLMVTLICEDLSSKLSLVTGMTDSQFKKVCSDCFKKQPENLLSVLSHSGEVLNVSRLLADPRAILGNDKRNHELTVIFAESDDGDDPPRKRRKRDPISGSYESVPVMVDEDLTKEDKMKRLFTKLANDPEVQIIEQTFQVANIPGANTSGHVFLNDLIEVNHSTCLNESRHHKWQNILLSDDTYLASDCDEQLLITITFRRQVRIHSLKINAPNQGTSPKTLKLFANQSYMDFNNIHDTPPSQIINLTPKHFEPNQIVKLNSLKFAKVKSITVFVEDNQGGEKFTILEQIQFIGKPV